MHLVDFFEGGKRTIHQGSAEDGFLIVVPIYLHKIVPPLYSLTSLPSSLFRIFWRNRRGIINLNTSPLLLPTVVKWQFPASLFLGRAQPQPH
jgi:hypothetical protein